MPRSKRFRLVQVPSLKPSPPVCHHHQVEAVLPYRIVVPEVVARIMDVSLDVGAQQQVRADIVPQGIVPYGPAVGHAYRQIG